MEEPGAAGLSARRTLAADALIAGCYLSGTNTRRVRRALRALLLFWKLELQQITSGSSLWIFNAVPSRIWSSQCARTKLGTFLIIGSW